MAQVITRLAEWDLAYLFTSFQEVSSVMLNILGNRAKYLTKDKGIEWNHKRLRCLKYLDWLTH